jgi:glyoxylate reductase
MRVFVTRQVLPQGIARLYEAAEVRVWEKDSIVPYDELRREAARCDALLTTVADRVDAPLLEANRHLKCVANYGVGYDNIDVAAAARCGIPVGNTPGAVTEATADLAFALLMTGARRLMESADYVARGEWTGWHPQLFLGMDVYRATLGIIGFGRIGQAVARRARGFEMRILYSGSPKPQAAELGAQHVPLETLLAESDFVSVHTAFNPQTYHLIGAAQMAQMKPTAMLINTARGGVVDPHALYEALRAGTIACAALDVTEPEPIPPDSPLLTLSNCLIVPHIGSATVRTRIRMGEMATENILAALRGDALPYAVT